MQVFGRSEETIYGFDVRRYNAPPSHQDKKPSIIFGLIAEIDLYPTAQTRHPAQSLENMRIA